MAPSAPTKDRRIKRARCKPGLSPPIVENAESLRTDRSYQQLAGRRWSSEQRMSPHGNRWMVFDTITGSPAAVNGVWQIDLSLEDADDLADALSYLHAKTGNPESR
jgi:hypothetical protein